MYNMRARLGQVRAVDMEKVAWVLGKEGVDVGKGEERFLKKLGVDGDAEGNAEGREAGEAEEAQESVEARGGKRKSAGRKDVDGEEETTRKKSAGSAVRKGAKRKAGEGEAPIEGVRRSSRRKTAP